LQFVAAPIFGAASFLDTEYQLRERKTAARCRIEDVAEKPRVNAVAKATRSKLNKYKRRSQMPKPEFQN
jgi:hypothetical protein